MTKTIKVKAGDLTGVALDWAVAKCEGWTLRTGKSSWFGDDPWFERKDEGSTHRLAIWRRNYSANWKLAGPIIEREQVQIDPLTRHRCKNSEWQAQVWCSFSVATGPTPLIAAMRCYVAAKLGDEIEVPVDLAEGGQ